jgi:hypothetical protein
MSKILILIIGFINWIWDKLPSLNIPKSVISTRNYYEVSYKIKPCVYEDVIVIAYSEEKAIALAAAYLNIYSDKIFLQCVLRERGITFPCVIKSVRVEI